MVRQHWQRSAVEMLNDIPSETAQQVLNAVRYQCDAPGSTMIPELDQYLLNNMRSVPSLQSSLNRGDVIEIQGPAASGKTQLLYHLTATCILPCDILVNLPENLRGSKIIIGGWEKSVVIFDCDGRWDICRLHNILVTRLTYALSMAKPTPLVHELNQTVESVAFKSLSRLHLFRPTSSLQLTATLLSLPNYHEEKMAQEEVRLLLVDSISAFYWADRWQIEISGSNKTTRPSPLGAVVRSLQAFRQSHGPVTIVTNWGLNTLPSTAPHMSSDSLTPFFKQHLASPYPAPFEDPPRGFPSENSTFPLTCHITIPFSFVPPLQLSLKPPGEKSGLEIADVREALYDENRKEVVERGEIGIYFRNPRHSGTQDIVFQNAFGRSRLRILEHDVVATSP